MLHWLGFDNAAVLDGGYDKWIADGRPVSTEPSRYPRGRFSLNARPDVFVAKGDVLAAIGSSDICTINALGPDFHSGTDASYGRPGHVPGSVNVPAAALVNPETLEMLPPDDLARIFERAGVVPGNRIITYCGGGIAATLDAFLLHQLGFQDVAVYDNSMSEWAIDPTLPMETG
jgi:thiosulfate/3-mercaptopyruvate sulfurtransferase